MKQYSFHSDILNEDVIITTYKPAGQPAEDINVYFYSDGNDIIVTTYDSSEDYYPTAYFGSVRSLLDGRNSRQSLNIILNLVGLGSNLFTIIENPPSWDENHLLNFPGIVYLGNASFQTVGSMISITGYVLACFPEATTTIIGGVASFASSAINIAGELGMNIQQEYEWYRIIGTNFIFCIAVSQPNPGSIIGYVYESGGGSIYNALVKLYNSSGSYTGDSDYSSNSGYFILSDIAPANYYLIISKTGYEDKRDPNSGSFTVSEGETENRGTIYLNPIIVDFEFVDVPAGLYTYGEDDEILTIYYDYQIMKYEVTNQQYVDYLEEAYAAGDIWIEFGDVVGYYEGDEYWGADNYDFYDLGTTSTFNYARISWNGSSFIINVPSGYNTGDFDNHPVVYVTWFGSNSFALHYGLLLPTEQEWEKAARGNTGWDYPWGDNINGSRANYGYSGDPFDDGTTPVGFYNGQYYLGFQTTDSPSPYDVYDMAGNVSEWTSSFWSDISSSRVRRGGNWLHYSYILRSWNRHSCYPTVGCGADGFRCVLP